MSSDDLLKKLNLGMMFQQNFIQQPLLELLLKGEAHVDRVSVLVEPQFRGEKMGFEASQREEEPLRLENLLTDLVRQTWGCPFHR